MRYEVHELTEDGYQLLLRTDSYDEACDWGWANGHYILDTMTKRYV